MEHFKDNSGCSGPKKSEIFWNNSRKVQYVFAGATRQSNTSNQEYFAGCNLHYGPIGNFFAGLTDRDRKKERQRKGDRIF